MSDIPQDVIRISLRFGIMTDLGLYQDTLYFTEDEWAKRDEGEIAKSKQNLADIWVAFRSEQIKEEQALVTQAGIDAKIAEYQTKISDAQANIDLLQSLSVSIAPVDVISG